MFFCPPLGCTDGARTLKASLVVAGYLLVDKNDDDAAITDDLPCDVRQDLVRLYKHLGGVLDLRDFAAGEWDFNLAGGFKIELDEYMHFNRHRAESCSGPWAPDVPWRCTTVITPSSTNTSAFRSVFPAHGRARDPTACSEAQVPWE